MTVPGVGLVTATSFLARVGQITRFPNPNRLVSYLGRRSPSVVAMSLVGRVVD